ncbi:MAG: D-sedoheptulose 7-phosphate isomerase [Nitrospinota bacterium]|nr:D-sedoheptulose 7-phosphate isomerase [Nitrospinota bacterium]
MQKRIEAAFLEATELRKKSLEVMRNDIEKASNICIESILNGGKVILMGNGGSAADAQHIAAELVGRFLKERSAIAGIALTTNTSILTCLGNDYSYDYIFERQMEALGRAGDVAIGISTSGNSENVYRALQKAQKSGIKTIGLLGKDGGKIAAVCDLPLIVPSSNTPRVQEIHILIGHILSDEIERAVYEREN